MTPPSRSSLPGRPAVLAPALAILVFALPVLAIMLVPDLMRSRAGLGTTGILIGLPIYAMLVLAAVVLAPWVSTLAGAERPDWTPSSVRRSIRRLRRAHPAAFWMRIGILLAMCILSQAAGLVFAELVPYAVAQSDAGGGASWRIAYGPYAAQAIIIFAIFVAGLVTFALGLRRDVRRLSPAEGSARAARDAQAPARGASA
ncbi:hypothetical protein F6B41_00955 [Microbacterium lushaniae]|nr:hypothetical protein F6B41_18855 [Microbacterium lushaniae]KAA9159523.1 hypothetical protein F6B41_00955 [Microbacterium lushaniae]